MRLAASASFALAIAIAGVGCSLLVDTGGYAGGEKSDAASADAGNGDGGAGDGGSDVDGSSTATTPLFDPGSTWPVFTSTVSNSPTTPALGTSANCTDLIVLANSGINAGNTATAAISTTTGMTFSVVVKDAGNNADTVYIWKATNPCVSRAGTVTVTWSLSGGGVLWSNVAVFAFTHSKGVGAVANAHNPGNTSVNKISITPTASRSWLFASLSGNNGMNADVAGTAGSFVQQWSSEAAVQSFGPSRTPSASTAGVPVTFSLTSPDNIWANVAAEVLSL
jgi:hypothetical protein